MNGSQGEARVLFVCEYATLNGGEHSLLAWIPPLREAGIELTVLAPPAGRFIDALTILEIPVFAWAETVPPAQHNRLAARRERLAEVIGQWQPDLVHANSLSMSRLAGPVAKAQGVPSLGHLRDIIGVSRQVMQDINANSQLLAVSQATADWHIARGLQAERTCVLYNGIDTEQFRAKPASGCLHRELQLPDDARLIGAIGQVVMRKGLDTLLSAAAKVCQQISDVHLVVVGERFSQKKEAIEFEQHLHQTANQRPLAGRVHFLGYREDAHQLLHELTLLVHTARQEPLGRVLLEAAALELPVVATDVGGTREIFPDGEALLVPPDNEAVLASAIVEALNEPMGAAQWAARARNVVETRFNVHRSSQALAQHYHRLLAGERGA